VDGSSVGRINGGCGVAHELVCLDSPNPSRSDPAVPMAQTR
jgi:hypothetical protein